MVYRLARLSALGIVLTALLGCATGNPAQSSVSSGCQAGETLVCRGMTASNISPRHRMNSPFCTCQGGVVANR